MRAPNQLAFEGIEALHCVSLIVKSTFLSISQSSTKIKLVKLFNPALTDVVIQKIKSVQKKYFFKNSEVLITSGYLEIVLKKMGRLRFELRTSRLKAGCSTTELATLFRPILIVQYEKYHVGEALMTLMFLFEDYKTIKKYFFSFLIDFLDISEVLINS